jgi:hypothetical protein
LARGRKAGLDETLAEIGGRCPNRPYQPNKGGIEYVLKNTGPEDFDEIEFELSSSSRLQSEFKK